MPITSTDPEPTPNALGRTTFSLRTRQLAVPKEVQKKKGGKPVFMDVYDKETFEPSFTSESGRTFTHKPVMVPVTVKEDGKDVPVLDCVDNRGIVITQELLDDTKAPGEPGYMCGTRTGDETELPIELQAEFAAFVVKVREHFASSLGVKVWAETAQ